MVQRLIAQGVLLAMLVGIFAPLAPATLMPHACCLRHRHHCHMPHDAGFSSRTCGHECCRLLSISTALFSPVGHVARQGLPASRLIVFFSSSPRPVQALPLRWERGPPQLG